MEVESRGHVALATQPVGVTLAPAPQGPYIQGPVVGNLSVSDQSTVHLGPKVYQVTQHVTHKEVVRDVSCPKYVLSVVRESSRAEKVACSAALALLLVCTVFILHFTLWAATTDVPADVAPHEWNITREMWLARQVEPETRTEEQYWPLRLVVLQHTVSSECHRFIACAAELRNLQSYFLDKLRYNDIPYNFIIGNEGRVYEGRGWGVVGAHTRGYNNCSLGIGFIGDYRPYNMNTKFTAAMTNSTQKLLDYGVEKGFLHPDYVIKAARDMRPTESPGQNIYDVISTWKHFDKVKLDKGWTCEQICNITTA